MNELAEFNREEWADKPFTIRLVGGPDDGKEFRWDQLPLIWRVPERPVFSLADAQFPTSAETPRTLVYRETGSVTDDGAHLYSFVG